MKQCLSEQIINPKTGRCVNKTGKIGKELMKSKSPKRKSKKSCLSEQIINPKTGRCVNKTGKIGKELMKSKSSKRKSSERKSRSKTIKSPTSCSYKKSSLSLDGMCEYFIKYPLTEKERKIKWEKLLAESSKKISLNFTSLEPKDLQIIFNLFDKIYFDNLLHNFLCYGGHTLTFTVKVKGGAGVAGYCKKDGCHFTINIDELFFTKIFKSKEQEFYQTNGLTCINRLECFLMVFAHELIHLIIQRFCSGIFKQIRGGHGPDFKALVYNLFGQTKIHHGLFKSRVKSRFMSPGEILRKEQEEKERGQLATQEAKKFIIKRLKIGDNFILERIKYKIIKFNPTKVRTSSGWNYPYTYLRNHIKWS